jgi:hypothetical protein
VFRTVCSQAGLISNAENPCPVDLGTLREMAKKGNCMPSKRKRVFVWSHMSKWKQKILQILGDLTDSEVINILKSEPPDSFYQDDSQWIDSAINRAYQKECSGSTFDVLAERLPQYYSHIRVFHACRPINVESYYRQGFIPMNPIHMQSVAKKYFLQDGIRKTNEEAFEMAISKIGTGLRANHIYFGLDDRFLLESCGHYLIYGSEYLLAIAVRLAEGKRILQNMGIPTMLACDLPFSMIESWAVREFAGALLSTLFRNYANSGKKTPTIDFAFWIKQVLPPECIHSHYHPERIPDPRNLMHEYQSPVLSCPFCAK